jgi:hypothetical protein
MLKTHQKKPFLLNGKQVEFTIVFETISSLNGN